MKPRGLYGQKEGNEHRSAVSSFAERLEDNAVVEGNAVAVLRSCVKTHDWTAFQVEVQKLRAAGHSQARLDSMIARASSGVRL
jgi:hypothetical protein